MIELSDDDVRAAFEDYRGSQGPRVRAAGVDAARRRGLARRRRRYGFLSATAIVALLVPAAAVTLNAGGTPIGGDLPRPSAGGLTRAELMVSSVQMPVFEGDPTGSCPHGEVGFADDRLVLYTFPDTGEYMQYADVDSDGSVETVLHVRCLIGEKVVAEQVLAVEGGEGSSVKLKGRVAGTGGDISAVGNVSIGPNRLPAGRTGAGVHNAIYLTVAGPRTCCETFYTAVEHQRRVYVWDGRGFKQQAGSDAFDRPPADLVVTAPAVRFESQTGILKLTITNAGSQSVDRVMLTLMSRGMHTVGEGWAVRAPGIDPATIENVRTIGRLEPGDIFTTDVTLLLGTGDVQLSGLSIMAVGIIGRDEVTDEVADANPVDNEDIEVVLRFD